MDVGEEFKGGGDGGGHIMMKELALERETRKQLEEKTMALVRDIKQAQLKKHNDMLNELQLQKSLVQERDYQISEMQETMTKLRAESSKLQEELQRVRRTSGEMQQQVARKYRGSITQMESRLFQNSSELETKIQDMNNNHEQELHALQNALKRRESEFTEQLTQQSAEIAHLQGRLEEARNSRNATLEEMRQLRKKYNSTIKNLEDCLEEVIEKNKILEQERDNSALAQVTVLEEQLETTRREKHRMSIRLESIEIESQNKEQKILELDRIVSRLESTLHSLDQQRTDLLESTKDFLKKGKDYDVQVGATQVLEAQLAKCQSAWDITKEDLITTKERAREVDRKYATLEKDFNSCKVDLRIIQREKKDLEERMTRQQLEVKKLNEQMTSTDDHKKEMEKKVTALEKEFQCLTSKFEEESNDAELVKKLLEEKRAECLKLSADLSNALAEIVRCKGQLEELEVVRCSFEEKEAVLKEKNRIIAEKDRKITHLLANIKSLKEILTVLESQIQEFEGTYNKKCQEFQDVIRQKAAVESELSSQRDDLRKTKCELNEVKSLKLFTQKKLDDVETTLHNVETANNAELQALTNKLEELSVKNQYLLEQLDTKSANYEENEITRNHMKNRLEDLKKENFALRDESSSTIQELVKLKKQNMEYMEALQIAVDKAHDYKERMESVQSAMRALEAEKNHSDMVVQTTLEQHAKLVEHLRSQNDLLSAKKKKGISGWLFGRDPDQTPNSTPSGHLNTTHSAAGATPRRILKEHNVVKNLEEEAVKMKRQLEMLQNYKTKDVRVDRELITTTKENISPVKKEECVMLRTVEEVTSEESTTTSMSSGNSGASSPARTKIGLYKTIVYSETGNENLYINCVTNMLDDIYLLGCEQGLYSTRMNEDSLLEDRVKISGVDAVFQIELIMELNYAVMIEGEERELVLVHLGLLRACAEAASCSKPKVQVQLIGDLDNCIEFKVKRISSDEISVVVTTQKTLNILVWEKNTFVLKKTLKTPHGVTGLCLTPNSLLFGRENEKIFELDLKNFQLEEFMDDSDQTLSYIFATCRDTPTFPLAILDVGLSSLHPGQTSYTSEYLLCFPEVAVFVDLYGRRSRPVNIVWSKLPVSVVYSHPYLYIVHFGSVEVIRLSYDSFTTVRVGLNKDCVGEEKEIIPESRFIPLTNPRFLGNGLKDGSIIIGSFDKTTTEVVEVGWG